jgi:hypothetical protein
MIERYKKTLKTGEVSREDSQEDSHLDGKTIHVNGGIMSKKGQ